MLQGLKKKPMQNVLVNKPESSPNLNKNSPVLECLVQQLFVILWSRWQRLQGQVQLFTAKSFKTNIVYDDAQVWLSNFLSHQ